MPGVRRMVVSVSVRMAINVVSAPINTTSTTEYAFNRALKRNGFFSAIFFSLA
jgi:hypothetical protein